MKRTIRKTIAAVMSLIVTIGAFSLNGLKAYADSDNVDISSKYATKLNVGDYDNYLRMNDSFFFMSDTDKSSETVKKSNTYDCINLNADSKIKYVDSAGNITVINNSNQDGTAKYDAIYGCITTGYYKYTVVRKGEKTSLIDSTGELAGIINDTWYDDILKYNTVDGTKLYVLKEMVSDTVYNVTIIDEEGNLIYKQDNCNSFKVIGNYTYFIAPEMTGMYYIPCFIIMTTNDNRTIVIDVKGNILHNEYDDIEIMYYDSNAVSYKTKDFSNTENQWIAIQYKNAIGEYSYGHYNYKTGEKEEGTGVIIHHNGTGESEWYSVENIDKTYIYDCRFNKICSVENLGEAVTDYIENLVVDFIKEKTDITDDVTLKYKYNKAGLYFEYNTKTGIKGAGILYSSTDFMTGIILENYRYSSGYIYTYLPEEIDITRDNGKTVKCKYKLDKIYDLSGDNINISNCNMELYSTSYQNALLYTVDGKQYKMSGTETKYYDDSDVVRYTIGLTGYSLIGKRELLSTGYYSSLIYALYDSDGNKISSDIDRLYDMPDVDIVNYKYTLENYVVLVYKTESSDKYLYNVYTYDGKLVMHTNESGIIRNYGNIIIFEGNVIKLSKLIVNNIEDILFNNNIKAEINKYDQGKLLTGLKPDMKAVEVIKMLGDNVHIKDTNGNELTDAAVGTGCVVELTQDNKATDTATVVVKGDIDGNGTIDILDMEAIQKTILGIGDKLSGAYKEAASLTDNDDITVLDMEVIQKDILGIQKIN